MKKFIIGLFVLWVSVSFADEITLTEPQVLQTPEAVKISDWEIVKINAQQQNLTVKYRWKDASGGVVALRESGNAWNYWSCTNDAPSTCFSDIFGFTIREQDVGTSIGVGLRTLIWDQMKQDVLTGTVDGSFD